MEYARSLDFRQYFDAELLQLGPTGERHRHNGSASITARARFAPQQKTIMLSGLILTAFLMGVGGIPHCAAMCGAPCAAAFPGGLPRSSLIGRCVGYGLLGTLAASAAGTLAAWGRQIAFLQPLWVLVLAGAAVLGLYLLRTGRMPPRVDDWGQDLYRRVRSRWAKSEPVNGPSARSPWGAFLAGMAWVLMPCGLLYAALTVAALAPHAWGGALVMLAFAVPGALGVWAAPMVLGTLTRRDKAERSASANTPLATPSGALSAGSAGQAVPLIWMTRMDGGVMSGSSSRGAGSEDFPAPPNISPNRADVQQRSRNKFDPRGAVRLSGLMLSAMSGWALYHQLLDQWRAWCA